MKFFRHILLAIGVSLAIHALLAAGIAFWLEYAPTPDAVALLDLTSVELNFAEEVEASVMTRSRQSRPQDMEVSQLPRMEMPKPKAADEPPEIRKEKRHAPDMAMDRLPEPPEASAEIMRSPTAFESSEPPEQIQHRQSATPSQAHLDAPPRQRRNIRADYPRESRLRGEHGDVLLELEVTAEGTVADVRVIGSPGYARLEAAAVKAARAARFTPAVSGGKPVCSTVRLTLTFRLK